VGIAHERFCPGVARIAGAIPNLRSSRRSDPRETPERRGHDEVT